VIIVTLITIYGDRRHVDHYRGDRRRRARPGRGLTRSVPVHRSVTVLELQNPAGDYVLPTAVDVTTALTRALIDENPHSPHFLQEDLDPVYAFKNPKSYPLSNYSYYIVPRTDTVLPTNFTKAKGKTLSIFTEFTLCAGQLMASHLGYAPLPPNLVAGGLLEVRRIPGHVAVPARCPKEALSRR
jgi:hypothetical protein